MIKYLLLVSLGGALGAPLRFILSSLIQNSFPFNTLIINISGSFLIGVFAVLIKNFEILAEDIFKYFIMVGFLGSFTTFSAFSIEVVNLYNLGNYYYAVLYTSASLVLNIIAAFLGYNILRLF
ncbi:MAG: putative fluoride ion transporter CrcB [Alphaproteobacteria bacterium MarineAlpha5_Bin12]|nr:MAG: putative fluoride ion transporter CrcB [Alphaproteobacteria bacterium MarineAlpha5_Bin12]